MYAKYDRLPFMHAECKVSACAVTVIADHLAENFENDPRVVNEMCYVVDKEPIIAASCKNGYLNYYMFIDKKLKLFDRSKLANFRDGLGVLHREISGKISKACGSSDALPQLSELDVSMEITKQVP